MNKGTPKEILSFVEENDVKFIRLTFTDIHGNLKNIAIIITSIISSINKSNVPNTVMATVCGRLALITK